jgi:hypothetical protein
MTRQLNRGWPISLCWIGLMVFAAAVPNARQKFGSSDLAGLSLSPTRIPGDRQLAPPPDARLARPFSQYAEQNVYGSDATFDTTLTVEAIATHYSRQIRSANWQLESMGIPGLISVLRFSGRSTGGVDVTSMLVVRKREDRQLTDVSLRILRNIIPGPPPGARPRATTGPRRGGGGASGGLPAHLALPDGVSTEVADVIYQPPSTLRPTTLQRDAPPGFPPELHPADSTIALAGIAAPGNVVVFEAPQLRWMGLPKFATTMAATAQTTGWSQQGSLPTLLEATPRTPPRISLCRGADVVDVDFFPRAAAGLYVRSMIRTAASPCRVSATPLPFMDIALPLVMMPSGVGLSPFSAQRSSDTYVAGTIAATSLSAAALGDAIDAQLGEQGWRRTALAVQGNAFWAGAFQSTAVGAAISAVVVLTPLSDGKLIDVWLRVVR